ncbi:PstS family phosphate ABC transporter substrate-binding protein [Natronomonas salina]|uniref:PstS family phosphate ABC transporter substrate-binding protein n=1 Tax=Natronomonas salina TaxID=1710540 RepID=UPI0015B77BB2|nr:PstS family phosphate ABC transporter substrate-binding protein [Natronomonas salina]QLD89740.1 PstS family phosphate ABC transporter substrate-binding protein [Natronomonas salina]
MTADSTGTGTGASSRRDVLLAGAGLAGGALSGCLTRVDGDVGDGLSGSIAIAGSSTVFPLMSAMAEEFRREHPDVSIDISRTGSGGGFSNFFCVGDTDFNNASREIQPEEEELCASNRVEPVEIRVATDALTVIVNNEAGFVDCVTVEELQQIWGPDAVSRWSQVRDDWPDAEIQRYGAAETSGTFDYFSMAINGEEGAHTSDYQATERDNDIVTGVTGNQYAMGYFGFSYYYSNPEQVTALQVDHEGGGCVGPSLDAAAAGEYTPLSRPLFTYAAKDALAREPVAEFARFVVEQSGRQELVADAIGYVPLNDEQQAEQRDTVEKAIEEVQQ